MVSLKTDAINITRIAVTAAISLTEFGINYFAMHMGGTLPFNSFTALMVQDIAVFPTIAWFVSKITANATTVSVTTSTKAN